ncbi:MAG: hypothetical protein RH942_04670 [Kiloniellaceae bacterium]
MRLDFNALWFDDQPDAIRDAEESLRPMLLDLGFDLQVNAFTDFSDADFLDRALRQGADEWDIDLILLDFDLGQGLEFRGSDFAVTIRQQFPHKEIVFYSGHGAGIPALREALYQSGIDGAFPAMRDQLVDQAFDIIQNLIKKVVDLDHMRGIVMAETSELDDLIGDCLVVAHAHMDDTGKASIRKYIADKLGRSLKSNTNKVAALHKGIAFEDLQALAPQIFSSYFQRLALLKVLRALGWDGESEHSAKVQLLDQYKPDVADLRDVLAHAKLIKDGREKVLRGANGRDISDDDMITIRAAILRHRSNMQAIQIALQELIKTA